MYRIYTVEKLALPQNQIVSVNFTFDEGKFILHSFLPRAIENYKSPSLAMEAQPIYCQLYDNTKKYKFSNELIYYRISNTPMNSYNPLGILGPIEVKLNEPYEFNYLDVLTVSFMTTLTTTPTGICLLIGELIE